MAEGYKDWSAGDILTAADLEDYTVKQSVMRFDDSSARTTALSGVLTEGMMSYLKDTDTVEVYDGSAWAAVAGGKILQVASATLDTTASTTSSSYTDTGLTVSITPSSATSKVFVLFSALGGKTAGANSGSFTILRDSTDLIVPDTPGNRTQGIAQLAGDVDDIEFVMLPLSIGWLDSPATTSATTYKVQFRTNGGTVYVNRTAWDSDSSGSIRGVSSIVAMEVSA